MAQHIRIGAAILEIGNGVPSHIGDKATLFFDLDGEKMYVNRDGIADWRYFLDSTTTGSTSGDTFITGFSYDNQNNLTLYRNDSVTFSVNISVFTGLTVSGTVSATTYYGDGSHLTGVSGTGSTLFSQDIVVSLSGGKTMGKYLNGQTIPASGKTAEQVIRDIAIEDIAPTYTPATFSLSESLPSVAEVGTVYATNTLNATFTQNDAGLLSAIRIQKNGTDMIPTGTTSPWSDTDNGSYVLGNITYNAYCNYASGITKNYTPSGNPDGRTPAIRTPNAPQAAENNFASNSVVLTGYYNIFYGPSASVPATSADVRALPSNRFTNAGNVFNLDTGSVDFNFTVAMPATLTLVQVLDLDALNANITANYILSTFNVNDAGGNPVSYNIYTMTNAVPYAANHRHQITIS